MRILGIPYSTKIGQMVEISMNSNLHYLNDDKKSVGNSLIIKLYELKIL